MDRILEADVEKLRLLTDSEMKIEDEKTEPRILNLLKVLQKLLKSQSNNFLFYSLDRFVDLLQISCNYEIIYYVFFCGIEYIRDPEQGN